MAISLVHSLENQEISRATGNGHVSVNQTCYQSNAIKSKTSRFFSWDFGLNFELWLKLLIGEETSKSLSYLNEKFSSKAATNLDIWLTFHANENFVDIW